MADLPSNSPQMFQLPGPQNIPMPGGPFQQLAEGVGQGMQLGQQQQALQQHQQALQQEKHKQEVDSALQLLATTGQQIQYLRPSSQKLAISNSLNALAKVAPEFGIQPHTPDELPDESVDLMKSYAKLHEAYLKGDVSAPTFQTEGHRILGEMSMYERNMIKENSNILGEPEMTPGQANGKPAMLNKNTGQVSDPQGQPMPGAQGDFIDSGQVATLKQSNQTNIANDFKADSETHGDVLGTAANALNMVAHPVPENITPEEKASIALQDKNALLKYAQVLIPASKRPPNMTMEDMIKSGLVSEIAKETWNKVTNGVPMSEDERSALTGTLGKTVLNEESQLTAKEKSHAGRAAFNQVNPMQALSDKRPPGIPSTSQLFKKPQVPSAHVHTGQILMNPADGKPYVFRGQTGTDDWKKRDKWMEIK